MKVAFCELGVEALGVGRKDHGPLKHAARSTLEIA